MHENNEPQLWWWIFVEKFWLIFGVVLFIFVVVVFAGISQRASEPDTAEHPSQDSELSEAEHPYQLGHSQDSELAEAELPVYYGLNAYTQGLYTEAISHFDKAIRIDPDYALAYRWRGNVYIELGQYRDADADHAKACKLGCCRLNDGKCY